MDTKKLRFKASTNVKDLFGKGLVTDPFAAIFELVKNSYDADAKKVEIILDNDTLIIKDNGSGMTYSDIETKWMTIGTNNKKKNGHSPKFHRTYNGDKGIGRFATDCLGRLLVMTSLPEFEENKYRLMFDWDDFEEFNENINEIEINTEVLKKKNIKSQGVYLKITNLRHLWTEDKINELIKQLRKFKSPFDIEDNFKIFVTAKKYGIEEFEIIKYNLSDISNLWVKSEISKDRPNNISIEVYHDGEKYTESYPNIYNFGPVKTQLYFFNKGDKLAFNSRIGTRVREFGNIRLYLDSFKIHPYGESYNDWMQLDKRHAQGTGRFFATRDLIGYTQVYKDYCENIMPTTNRQGLIENESVTELKEYIIEYNVKILEKYFFKVKKAKNEKYTEIKIESKDIQSNIKVIATNLEKSNPEAAKELKKVNKQLAEYQSKRDKYIKEQNDISEVYKRNASKEMLLNKIIHQALINIDTGDTLIKEIYENIESIELIKSSDIKPLLSELETLVVSTKNYLLQTRDNLITERKNKHIKLRSFITDITSNYDSDLRKGDISVDIDISDMVSLYIDSKDLKTIVENFISNSIKSLNKSNNEKKLINIKFVEANRKNVLTFSDTGIGIPEHLRDRIFDPFYSTTGGFGMGLSIVDDIVKAYEGELNILKTEIGAGFQIVFRRK